MLKKVEIFQDKMRLKLHDQMQRIQIIRANQKSLRVNF